MSRRANWDHATDPRPSDECPRCGEDRLIERVENSHTRMFCNVCSQEWRAEPRRTKDSHAV